MIEEIPYAGWQRNLRIQGPTAEIIITLEVGPRILRYAFRDGKNVFVEMPEELGHAGEKEWMIRGGHRFWTAPEGDHSYDPDNGPVTWRKSGDRSAEIIQPPSEKFGFQKKLRVEMLEDELVRVTHLLTNTGTQPLEISPWALSVMAPGGVALIPQPKLDLHPGEFPEGRETKPEEYLPNRELILWPFTNLADGRYTFSESFLRVRQLESGLATKIGLKLSPGWVAYQNGDVVFAKHFGYHPSQPYPDRGANFELFTNKAILELETLAPKLYLDLGDTAEHVEHWALGKAIGDLSDEETAREYFDMLPKIG